MFHTFGKRSKDTAWFLLLFVCGFTSHSFGDVTIIGEGLQLWPMLATHNDSFRAIPTVGQTILYIGHLREPVTLIPVAERLAVELSLSVLTTCRDRESNLDLSHARRTLYHWATTKVTPFERLRLTTKDEQNW